MLGAKFLAVFCRKWWRSRSKLPNKSKERLETERKFYACHCYNSNDHFMLLFLRVSSKSLMDLSTVALMRQLVITFQTTLESSISNAPNP